FVVQMVLEGRGSLDVRRLAAAVEQASELNPGSRLILKGVLRGSRWVDSGRAPVVRVVSGEAWDGYGPENAPFLHGPLPSSGPTCEVLWVEGPVPRIIFRASHGVMDGRGVMTWAEDVFRIMQGAPFLGTQWTITDEQIMSRITEQTRETYIDRAIAPTGESRPDGQEGIRWRRLTFTGTLPALVGKVGWALAQSAWRYGDGLVRLMVPVDLRSHQPDLRCTSNLTTSLYVDVTQASSPESITDDILEQLDSKTDCMPYSGTGMIYVTPIKLLRLGFTMLSRSSRRRGVYNASALISNLGHIDTRAFSADDFSAETCFFVPPPLERAAVFVALAGCLGREEVTVAVSHRLGNAGRFERLLDDIRAALTPEEAKSRRISSAKPASDTSTYWQERLPNMPPVPDLPLVANPASSDPPRTNSRNARLDAESWQLIKNRARGLGLTPTAVIASAFSSVLARWSKIPRFTIGMSVGWRPDHPAEGPAVRRCAAARLTTLLPVDALAADDFALRTRLLQEELKAKLDERYLDELQGLPGFGRFSGPGAAPQIPVILSADLEDASGGLLPDDFPDAPQIWLHHRVCETDGHLVFAWDSLDEVFVQGVVEDMFASYRRYLDVLASPDVCWNQCRCPAIPVEHQALYDAVNATRAPFSSNLLHTLFLEQALQHPQAPAVITSSRSLSYGELLDRARRLGQYLRAHGAVPNTCVAVLMEKGWEQIAGVMGVLFSGAAYVPLDPGLPRERLRYLLEETAVKVVLTQSRIQAQLSWLTEWTCLCVDGDVLPAVEDMPPAPVQQATDLAYVIFTSGSTGSPKGVMIDHQGAVNTIRDINQRFGVGPSDRTLALSNLNFDLSVYDVFGLLAAGGAIVIPDAQSRQDPAHWADMLIKHSVTLWNTVPALMQLLVDYAEQTPGAIPDSVRLVMLSGDWIPVSLPDRIRAQIAGVQIISLGGATEASIWSILYPVAEVRKEWASIPYGKPMANQRFYVLDANLNPCPLWVAGELYIGGIGLALGYWNDPDKTSQRFIVHPESGERLYKTGDLGRWMPDGNIEFLGREDFQVKIHGHRIELGEIEAALLKHPAVAEVAVIAVSDGRGSGKHLLACVVCRAEDTDTTSDSHGRAEADLKSTLTGFLQGYLPEYMIPKHFVFLERLPLTANGKLDRQALNAYKISDTAAGEFVAPQNGLQETIARLWAEVLGIERVGIHDSFFDLGGDSLKVIMLKNRLKQELRRDIPLMMIYRHVTIAAFARFLEEGGPGSADPAPVEACRPGAAEAGQAETPRFIAGA
ncbi:MAG TPA: amino acid adenylation domain-containing protein, partial [Deltaproteobacteria bacterium]|nr:amino acid adenylation domain-containing protein [Deltaproteobacteria bacterium]